MSDKRQQILDLVKEYIIEKRESESWEPRRRLGFLFGSHL